MLLQDLARFVTALPGSGGAPCGEGGLGGHDAGQEAAALLQEAAQGGGSGSLADLFGSGASVALAGGDVVTLLGRQQQPLGAGQAACYMLLRCQPAATVGPHQVRRRLASAACVWVPSIVQYYRSETSRYA